MKKITTLILVVSTIFFATGSFLLSPYVAMASTISNAYDQTSNQNVSAYSTHTIKFRTPSALTSSGNTIAIAFPSDFDFTGSVYGDITLKDGASTGLENTETVSSSAGVSTYGVAFTDGACTSGKKCTLTITAPTSGTYNIVANYFVTIGYTTAAHCKNATTAGSKTITITTSSDTGTTAIPIISNSSVTLDATVAPTLSFSNDNSALHFGTLSASAATWANTTTGSATSVTGNTFTISTNATSGYTLAYNAAATLTSGSNTIAATNWTNDADGTPGTAQFAMSAVYSGTLGNLTTAYQHATGNGNWKFNTAGETLITNTAAANAETVAMRYIANIANTTPAGVYSQTNTWVVTANF
ncbi:MAG: hypothetical protein WCK29_00265 [archaeon]